MENATPQATTTVSNPYGLEALWVGGDPVSRSVLILLLIMSLASWYVMLASACRGRPGSSDVLM